MDSRQARATYHPGGYGVSEGLKRARRPFRSRNVVTGALIFGFAASVYLYSIRAVAQDDFSDLDQPLSDEQRRSLTSIEEVQRSRDELRLAAKQPPSAASAPLALAGPAPGAAVGRGSGVLELVRGTFAGRGAESKIVWGAPDVDRIGRIGADVPAQQYSRRLV